MFACPTCGFKNHEGALFCEACGSYFHANGPLATNTLPQRPNPGPSTFGQPDAEPAPPGQTLVLACLADQRRFVFRAGSVSALIGRGDRKSRLVVDIDLTGADGQTFGVSRRHARVHFSNGHFLIEDLESLNGTALNARPLRPYLQEVLHAGDEITLGDIVLKVSLEDAA
jgi:pSer/pThr/pTyr-binding forkhead associated (FHA) protein